MAEKCNMKLVYSKTFHDFFQEKTKDSTSLLYKMKALEVVNEISKLKTLMVKNCENLKGIGHAILGNFNTDRMVIELTKILK